MKPTNLNNFTPLENIGLEKIEESLKHKSAIIETAEKLDPRSRLHVALLIAASVLEDDDDVLEDVELAQAVELFGRLGKLSDF